MSSIITRQAKGRKLAEESQLLAEERFIIEAIKKIRAQRNCLQIERLQLESMLAEQKHGPLKKTLRTQQIVDDNTKEQASGPSTSVIPMSERFEFADIEAMKPGSVRVMDEELCNFEELNLTVSQPMVHASSSRYPEEEEEEEYSSCDENTIIDMNMFMTN